ncbi:helix-turn-helix domain-containing protein [Vreelandella stevensii]|uniref:helix-turn-helix domain-containing protein n=1 Tax=Vreelandella stevensii TaxID=502821 RepID=UPI0037487F54
MIGERLLRARKAAGLSMKALADQVGVSATMINKYEKEKSTPGSKVLIQLSKALGVRSEYFFRPVKAQLEGVEYRKRASTPQKLLNRIEADVLDQAERWQMLANLYPRFPLPDFAQPTGLPAQIASLDEVDTVSYGVRDAWALGRNPIPDLMDVLEAHGILVILTGVDDLNKFDGLQASVAGKPFIVVSRHWSGDRQRFTLAHELGHLILHGRLGQGVDEEKACNRFASAFLLPERGLRQQLGEQRHHLEAQELYLLKHEYGISMAACLYRAADLGIIDEGYRKRAFILFRQQGWHKGEPGEPYPAEESQLFTQLVYRALGEGIISESKAAELLKMPLMQFHRERNLEPLDAVAGQ